MYYIDAVNLIKSAVENNVLTTHTQPDPDSGINVTGILIFVHGSEEPELWTEEYLAQSLMTDPEGEKSLIEALTEKGIEFLRFEGSQADNALKAFTEKM